MGCAVDSTQSTLLAIGGVTDGPFLDSVEVLNVEDIANVQNSEWITLSDTLHKGLYEHRAVAHGPNILTVGGLDGDVARVSVMNVINTVELTIYQSGSLDIGLYECASVVADSMAYC